MKLTLESDREALKRYRHVKPARGWSKSRCGARLRGSKRACTLKRGHSGPHVAHGVLGRILAVWDEGISARGPEVRSRSTASALSRQDLGKGGFLQLLKDFGSRVVRHPEHFLEEAVFLVFFLGMVVFVIDWALRILGLR